MTRPLPWFCRVAFLWSCLLSVAALTPDFLDPGWTVSGESQGSVQPMGFGEEAVRTVIRWTFCGVGLLAGTLLLTGHRAGIWPAYLFAGLGAVIFAAVVASIRTGIITLDGEVATLAPAIVIVALCAFVGGGSLGCYVLALHVFRHWSREMPAVNPDVATTASLRTEGVR